MYARIMRSPTLCYVPRTFGEEEHIDQLVHGPPNLVVDVFVLCILKRFGPSLRLMSKYGCLFNENTLKQQQQKHKKKQQQQP